MNTPEISPSSDQPRGGMMTQSLAILHDAYRDLNARKMFWIVLAISVVAIGVFAAVSVTPTSIKLLSYEFDTGFIPPKWLYKKWFSDSVIAFWLTWGAIILALISTASIFPDFLTAGSIDLFISKPISRMRLFLTKYAAGMLFAFLQVAIFAILAFFVVGIRGHIWEPKLFWMIPIVMCFFSYLFSISAFFGVLMRSTLAALLFTILSWLMIFAIHRGEVVLQASINMNQQEIADIDDSLNELKNGHPTTSPTTNSLRGLAAYFEAPVHSLGFAAEPQARRRNDLLDRRQKRVHNQVWLRFWHSLVFPVQVVVPKTTETVGLLYNMLLSQDEFQTIMDSQRQIASENDRHHRVQALDMDDEIDRFTRTRTLWWSLGSSLCFEFIMVILAGWVFCKRDY